jgi:DNA-binding IclR family transcriptional regulator
MSETLKTVEKTLQVLRAFQRGETELSTAEICRKLKVSRTAVTRILATLEQAGFLERASDGVKYRIGVAACEVGALYLTDNPLTKLADQTMLGLAQQTGFTSYLGKLYGDEIVILGVREGSQPIRFLWTPGDRLPAATTATGKAMLMSMDRSELDRILGIGRLTGLTAQSLQTREDLDRQLDRHRAGRWVPMAEESYPGVCGVGAAIVDVTGAPIAGISLSFLGGADEGLSLERYGELIVAAADAISQKLRAQGSYSSATKSENDNRSFRAPINSASPVAADQKSR